MNKDFLKFQKIFKSYQRLFGLTGYKVYFKYEPIENCFANISTNHPDMTATVRLNSKVPNGEKPYRNVYVSAKHEALHLLLNSLEDKALNRHAQRDEVFEAVEEAVHKLEALIPDLKEITNEC